MKLEYQTLAASLGARLRPDAGAGGRLAGLRNFFRYHGIFAPGVRLLRVLPMSLKVIVVGLGFVAPLAVMVLVFVGHLAEERAVQKALVREMAYSRAISQLQCALARTTPLGCSVQRLPAMPMEQARAQLEAARTDARAPHAPSWTPVEQAWRELAALPADSPLRAQRVLALQERLRAHERGVTESKAKDGASPHRRSLDAWLAAGLMPMAQQRVLRLYEAGLPAATTAGAAEPTQLRDAIVELRLARREVAALAQAQLGAQALAPAGAALDGQIALAERWAQGGERPSVDAWRAAAGEARSRLLDLRVQLLDDVTAGAQAQVERITLIGNGTVLVSLLGMVFAFYLLMSFYKVISGGVEKLRTQVKKMSSGDLSERPVPLGNDEIGRTLFSLATSLSMLGEMLAKVRQSASAVAHASHDIAKGNGDLGRRTQDSRNGLTRIVLAVQQYVALLDQCGQRVDEAVSVVEAMRLDAARSRANMGALQERMQSLQGKSREIDAIVGLIDGIAFRTNILALNASIEAAKAGEAGRGFAVVAQEVRRLAQRSAENARLISEIIGRSREDIDLGKALADRTGEDVQSTDRHVARIHESMKDVVMLTRSGQNRSQEILDEIRDLENLTDANGDLVQQVASASQSLSEQGSELSERVASFKLT